MTSVLGWMPRNRRNGIIKYRWMNANCISCRILLFSSIWWRNDTNTECRTPNTIENLYFMYHRTIISFSLAKQVVHVVMCSIWSVLFSDLVVKMLQHFSYNFIFNFQRIVIHFIICFLLSTLQHWMCMV